MSDSTTPSTAPKVPYNPPFKELWGITEERERALLAEFRELLERTTDIKGNATFDDYYLRRFLRARSHDLAKAEAMFASHLKWRRDFGTDTILEDFVYDEREAFLALYPQGYHKVDKLGRPIYIQHLGQINMKAMKNVTTEERMIRFHVQEYERALKYIFPACSEAAGEHVSQTLAIMDLKGLGLRHLSGDVKRILSVLTRIDQDNYPETLGKTLVGIDCRRARPTCGRADARPDSPSLSLALRATRSVRSPDHQRPQSLSGDLEHRQADAGPADAVQDRGVSRGFPAGVEGVGGGREYPELPGRDQSGKSDRRRGALAGGTRSQAAG